MKIRLPYFATLGVVALVLAGLQSPSSGDSGDDLALVQLIKDVTEQQTTIAANQAKIDEKLGVIAEQVRKARLLAARAK